MLRAQLTFTRANTDCAALYVRWSGACLASGHQSRVFTQLLSCRHSGVCLGPVCTVAGLDFDVDVREQRCDDRGERHHR